jgi:AraC family L-rhamnose operon transcriptional activator RhaR
MRHFRSLLIEKAEVRMPGLHVMRFALHRHLAEHASVELHRHAWCQALLYLSGRGVQALASRHGVAEARVEPGTLVVLPPGARHAFQRREARAPLCLMVDFRLKGARKRGAEVCNLGRSELAQVRQHVAHLLNSQAGADGALRWESAPAVLQLLAMFLRAAGWLERLPATPAGGGTGTGGAVGAGGAVRQLLLKMRADDSLAEVTRRSGYQRDYLNRLVKRETGLTLGQYRAQQRLARAKELLAQGVRVADVAAETGMPDQSYFARWFRRQTGRVPSAWGRGG